MRYVNKRDEDSYTVPKHFAQTFFLVRPRLCMGLQFHVKIRINLIDTIIKLFNNHEHVLGKNRPQVYFFLTHVVVPEVIFL